MMDDAELMRLLRHMNEYEPLGHDGWKSADRIEALISERDAARDAALEEAAKVADRYSAERVYQDEFFGELKCRTLQDPRRIAAAIRALKGKSHE